MSSFSFSAISTTNSSFSITAITHNDKNDNQEIFSILCGYASMISFIFALYPQIIVNFRQKSAKALSLALLTNWAIGDISNLTGCILTNKLPFQLYLALYFCGMDSILSFQYFYYEWFYPGFILKNNNDDNNNDNNNNDNNNDDNNDNYNDNDSNNDNNDYNTSNISQISTKSFKDSIKDNLLKNYSTFPNNNGGRLPKTTLIFGVLLFTFHTYHSASNISSFNNTITTSSLNSSPSFPFSVEALFDENNKKLIGQVMGYMCAFLYVTGRLPQIYKNYKRKSVKGLSMTMFIFVALGNITYSLSIFTNPLIFLDPTFIRSEISYFIGSLGTLTLDTVIFLQWKYYSVGTKRRTGIDDDSYNVNINNDDDDGIIDEGLEIIV
ncbi:hypothetical protein Glove_2g11 [Diversispora epigaea]|uniref:Uncharacterized protein n=1 Tax=Diversispora epigaea TaxID=1348612 RepID=A0A397JVY5_9GLOM|nr:hypothetical protein Glove_2g11 [Diversispora epigaea]